MEKLQRYFATEMIVETLQNGVQTRLAAKFENCNSSSFDFTKNDISSQN